MQASEGDLYLAHSLVAARADRVRDFVQAYSQLAVTVAARPIKAAARVAAARRLLLLLSTWDQDDHRAELTDMVELIGDDLERVRAGFRNALEYLDLVDDTDRINVEAALRGALEKVEPIPRVWARRLNRCIRRLQRLRELDGPAIILRNEVVLIARQLTDWRIPPAAYEESPLWLDGGCEGLLRLGTEACLLRDESGSKGVDLGLGCSHVAGDLLALRRADLDRLVDASTTGPDGPALENVVQAVAAFPFVPSGRMHELGPSFVAVRNHGEGIGPIGWAAGEDVRIVADAYAEQGSKELARVGENVRRLYRDGAAVLGCLELMSPESDGHRNWLVSADDPDT